MVIQMRARAQMETDCVWGTRYLVTTTLLTVKDRLQNGT